MRSAGCSSVGRAVATVAQPLARGAAAEAPQALLMQGRWAQPLQLQFALSIVIDTDVTGYIQLLEYASFI